ncbi:hypothetical protein [Nonomuraea sp. NPDC050310]|uniref:hypothetical protein n=1 Tax=Nonomuraea sp. NPDC050310 TaxID=3154935 RepID=UPI0033D3C641
MSAVPFTRGEAGDPPLWVIAGAMLAGVLQAWMLWQVLRGRERGELTPRGWRVGLLRLGLYLGVGISLAIMVLIPFSGSRNSWDLRWLWIGLDAVDEVAFLTTVVMFFLVLRGVAPRWLRLFALVVGGLAGLAGFGWTLTSHLDLNAVAWVFTVAGGYEYGWAVWTVCILIAQTRDPRFSAATIRIGAVAPLMSLANGSYGYLSYVGGDGYPPELIILELLGAVSVFGLVWQARTAHELAGPLPEPATIRRPVRRPARWWPLAATAVVLPLLPAAVNLAHGAYRWVGDTGVIEPFLQDGVVDGLAQTWRDLDIMIGVGAPALLVLATVLLRTRPLVRFTPPALALAALVGLAGLVSTPASEESWHEMRLEWEAVGRDAASPASGISPAWYSLALLGSAVLLRVLYPLAPARPLLVVRLAVLAGLVLLPGAALARGTITADAACGPGESWSSEGPTELTADQKLVCALRQANLIKFPATTPDAEAVAHARWLCGLYTRNDARELAEHGLARDSLTHPIAPVCPPAAATAKAAADESAREMQEWEADAQRMCDSRPDHRPLIRPATATRIREPQWTDYGIIEAYEETETGPDPFEDGLLEKTQEEGLVAALPGHLMISVHSDFELCVTVETYPRRPPVEVKGWDHVTEIGYESPGGQILLADAMGGEPYPDLALDGRAGHYRIRVHYDMFDWPGEEEGGQRLLIMAWPAKGDKVITYRKS